MNKTYQWLKHHCTTRLRDHLIPHEGNNHRPHFLRRKNLLLFLALILVVEVVFLVQAFVIVPTSRFLATILPPTLTELTNSTRKAHNLAPLRNNPLLERAALTKARDMADNSYFSHISPDGKTPWDTIDKAGYQFSYAGENLAVNFFDATDVVDAWMNSAKHRANILSQNFTEVGFGIAKGTYKGKEAIFVVQLFGRPALRVAVAEAAPVPSSEISTNLSTPTPASVEGRVQGVETASRPVSHPSFGERLAASPRITTTYIYLLLGALLLIGLLLTIVIRIDIQHPDLIIHGVTLLLLVAFSLTMNHSLALASSQVF